MALMLSKKKSGSALTAMSEISLSNNAFTSDYALVLVHTLGFRQNNSGGTVATVTYNGSGTVIENGSGQYSESDNYCGTRVAVITNVKAGDTLTISDNSTGATKSSKIYGC